MAVLRACAAFACAAVLSACAVGPDYRSPLPDAPAQAPFASADAAGFTAEEPPGEWWRLYDDPALGAAVAQALDANRDLAAAAANIARARAVLREARGARLPATSLSAGSSTGRQNIVGISPPISFEDTIYNVGFDVSYQADLFGRVRRAVEASRAEAEAVQAAYDVTRITVAAETARAYADACAAGFQLDVARDSVELQRRSYELTQRLLDAGRGTALDVSRAAAALEQTRAEIPALEAARSSALYRLAVLMGRPPAEYPQAAADCTVSPTLSGQIPVGDGAALLKRRPDVRRAERDLAAATAQVGVAVAELYPSVSIGAAAGSVALSTSDLGASDASRWSIGPLLSWSFPNRTIARARVLQAQASAEAALAAFDGVWLEALRETETALSDYANELDRVEALAAARDHSADAARLANARFEAGQVSFLDVLQAELTLTGTEMALAESRSRLSTLQIALFLALGGGWNVP
ncbi:MAG: TolC family protein [Gammaproteobacteria bacterium]|nr:TolC family protein [Gammaproteobacteria bacterium]